MPQNKDDPANLSLIEGAARKMLEKLTNTSGLDFDLLFEASRLKGLNKLESNCVVACTQAKTSPDCLVNLVVKVRDGNLDELVSAMSICEHILGGEVSAKTQDSLRYGHDPAFSTKSKRIVVGILELANGSGIQFVAEPDAVASGMERL